MFEEYKKYLKDNPNNYWFKDKLFGWGWTPVRWQGWVIVLVYVVIMIALSLTVDENSSNREVVFNLILPLIILTSTLIRICYKKGEKPHWQWGLPKSKNEDINQKKP